MTQVLGAFDSKMVEQMYTNTDPNVAFVDNFLSPRALSALQKWAIESTIWFDDKKSYLGAYIHEGIMNDILIDLVGELRQSFPKVIGDLPLVHLWAYKYRSGEKGINVHSDDALVNLNFWVTEDEANISTGDGGMVIFLRKPEAGWAFADFNSMSVDLDEFVRDVERVSIAYRQNRMVMFSSQLLHKTDDFKFRKGYKNRRINFTLLFGWRKGRS